MFNRYFLLFLFCLASHLMMAQKKDLPEKKVIMAIFAHPDDEAVSNVSPVLAKYATEATVYLVIATKGEMGVNKRAQIPAGDSLAIVRADEATCTCKNLGIKPPILLGMGDGALAKDNNAFILRQKLDSIFKLYKPDILITWGSGGGTGHVDHRIVGDVVTELFQNGENLKSNQLFYAGIPSENWKKSPLYKSSVKGMFNYWKTIKKEYLTTHINCSKQNFLDAEAAMQCNKSQFSEAEMEDITLWMNNTENGTVYLRPFGASKKVRFGLFE